MNPQEGVALLDSPEAKAEDIADKVFQVLQGHPLTMKMVHYELFKGIKDPEHQQEEPTFRTVFERRRVNKNVRKVNQQIKKMAKEAGVSPAQVLSELAKRTSRVFISSERAEEDSVAESVEEIRDRFKAESHRILRPDQDKTINRAIEERNTPLLFAELQYDPEWKDILKMFRILVDEGLGVKNIQRDSRFSTKAKQRAFKIHNRGLADIILRLYEEQQRDREGA